jgi:hypothetical protein
MVTLFHRYSWANFWFTKTFIGLVFARTAPLRCSSQTADRYLVEFSTSSTQRPSLFVTTILPIANSSVHCTLLIFIHPFIQTQSIHSKSYELERDGGLETNRRFHSQHARSIRGSDAGDAR